MTHKYALLKDGKLVGYMELKGGVPIYALNGMSSRKQSEILMQCQALPLVCVIDGKEVYEGAEFELDTYKMRLKWSDLDFGYRLFRADGYDWPLNPHAKFLRNAWE